MVGGSLFYSGCVSLLRSDRTPSAGVAAVWLDGEMVVAATPEATSISGLTPGAPYAKGLIARFGDRGHDAAIEIRSAQRHGNPTRHLLRTPDGHPYEVWARPVGGQFCLSFHDGSFLEQEFARPDGPRLQDADPHALALLRTLLGRSSLLVWQRSEADGALWADGRIESEAGSVQARQAAEMLGRGAPNAAAGTVPSEPISERRLEIAAERGAVALQVVEVRGADGVLSGFAVDAKQAAAAERTLTRFIQTMTETFAHLNVGLAIFDQNQTLALFNPALVNMWQLEPAWLARRPALREILDSLRSTRRIPDLRDYHGFRSRLLSLFDDPDTADYEDLWNLADGSTLRVLGRPHPHGSLALIFDDVTERMRLEQRNRNMDDLITSTLDRLHEGLAVFAPDGRLQFVNRAFHEIWDVNEAQIRLGTHVRDVADLFSRLCVDAAIWDRAVTYATGEANRQIWTGRVSLGSGRVLAARFAPMPDGSTLAGFTDVTDSERVATALKERNEALEAAEQLRAAVLDQISHRLRTPLNTVFGFGELLANPNFGALNEKQGEFLSGILEAGAQLLDTISEVTELASLQLDPLDGEEDEAGIDKALVLTRSLLEKRAAESQVTLVLDDAEPIGPIRCSPLRLRQIVFNLVADAIHRCPARGTVTLSAAPEGPLAAIRVVETADPAHVGSSAWFEANALTLSLVKRLVSSEHGTIDVELSAPSGTFSVTCRFPQLDPERSRETVPDPNQDRDAGDAPTAPFPDAERAERRC